MIFALLDGSPLLSFSFIQLSLSDVPTMLYFLSFLIYLGKITLHSSHYFAWSTQIFKFNKKNKVPLMYIIQKFSLSLSPISLTKP